MKKYGVFGILVILLAISAYFYFNKKRTKLTEKYTEFSISDTTSISKIILTQKGGEPIELVKETPTKWILNDKYKARTDAVQLLLEAFYKFKVKSPVAKAAEENTIKQMALSHKKVEVYLNGQSKPVKTYFIGENSKEREGCTMFLEIDGSKHQKPFLVEIPGFYGMLGIRFFTEEYLWRDREVFDYTKNEIKQLKFINHESPNASFIIESKEGNLILRETGMGGAVEQADTNIIADYLNRFKGIHFETIHPNIEETLKDSVIQNLKYYTIELTDHKDKVTTFEAFRMPNYKGDVDEYTGKTLPYNVDRFYGILNKQDFVVAQYPTFDKLYKEINGFMMPHK